MITGHFSQQERITTHTSHTQAQTNTHKEQAVDTTCLYIPLLFFFKLLSLLLLIFLLFPPYTCHRGEKVRCHRNMGGREITATLAYLLHVVNLVIPAPLALAHGLYSVEVLSKVHQYIASQFENNNSKPQKDYQFSLPMQLQPFTNSVIGLQTHTHRHNTQKRAVLVT